MQISCAYEIDQKSLIIGFGIGSPVALFIDGKLTSEKWWP